MQKNWSLLRCYTVDW